jgi:hypothetical protein
MGQIVSLRNRKAKTSQEIREEELMAQIIDLRREVKKLTSLVAKSLRLLEKDS